MHIIIIEMSFVFLVVDQIILDVLVRPLLSQMFFSSFFILMSSNFKGFSLAKVLHLLCLTVDTMNGSRTSSLDKDEIEWTFFAIKPLNINSPSMKYLIADSLPPFRCLCLPPTSSLQGNQSNDACSKTIHR